MTILIELHKWRGFSAAREGGVASVTLAFLSIAISRGSLLIKFRTAREQLGRWGDQ